ncbi:MAG TPA: hypothetical protein VJ476_10495 [Rhizomicrobium sp.]|nr:hypothetical protein [Rhizomicrobium sp.]
MTYFEYQAIYFGIIVGLALANILGSVHKLVEAGSRVRWGWMAPLTAGYAATFTLCEFWFLWIRRNDPGHHTILSWLPLAAAFALLYLMCAAALPDEVGEPGVDLNRYYTQNRYRLWGFAAVLHALNLCSWLVGFWEAGFDATVVRGGLWAVFGNATECLLSLSLIFVRATWWNALVLAGLWAFILSVFGPMPLS